MQFDVLLWPLVFHCNFSNCCYSGVSEAGVCIPPLPTPDTSTLSSSYEIECDCWYQRALKILNASQMPDVITVFNRYITLSDTERQMNLYSKGNSPFFLQKRGDWTSTNKQLYELRLAGPILAAWPWTSPCISFLISAMGTFVTDLLSLRVGSEAGACPPFSAPVPSWVEDRCQRGDPYHPSSSPAPK